VEEVEALEQPLVGLLVLEEEQLEELEQMRQLEPTG
jgi:hypothetical protein